MPERPLHLSTRGGDALLLLAGALFVFGWRAASLPLFDLDEGAFSEATRELLARGDWLMPTLNGEPRYDKPILIYWLQAIGVWLLGERELAFRLPSILCAGGWVLLVHGFVYERGGRVAAAFAAASLALSLMVGVIGHAATADALLNLCIAGALLDIWRWLDAPRPPLLLRVYLWLALGTLAKGPVAVAIPLAVALLQIVWTRRWRDGARAVFFWPGWLLYFAVLLPWALSLSLRDGGDFLRHFLFDHNIGRYNQTLQNHGGQLWYYLLWLPLILLPFAGLLPAAFAGAWRSRRDPLQAFLLSWFALVFVLFSFSSTQLPHYLLYGCTPLFVLLGRGCQAQRSAGAALLPGLIFLALLSLLPWLLPAIAPPSRRAFEAGIVEVAMTQLDGGYIAITLSALVIAALIALQRRQPLWRRLLGIALMQWLAVWNGIAPVLAAAQQEPVRHAALLAAASGAPAVSYRTDLPSFSVYRRAITPSRVPGPGEWVLVRRDRIGDLQRKLPGVELEPVYVGGGIALLRYPPP